LLCDVRKPLVFSVNFFFLFEMCFVCLDDKGFL